MSESERIRLIASHDSATRLAAAAQWLSAYPPDAEVLVLSPTREAGDEFVRSAACVSGARFGLLRLTLDRLAANLPAPLLARSRRVPTTGLSLEALAARVVHFPASEGALSYFAPVAKRPGFPRAVARTLQELRMNAVDFEAIRRLPRGGEDLAALAKALDRELATAGLADRAIIFQSALEATNHSTPGTQHSSGLPLLLLDFPLGTTLETELIQSLAKRAPRVLATAAGGDIRTIAMLERALGCKAEVVATDEQTTSLGSLKANLFQDS